MVEKTLVPHKHAEVIKAYANGKQIEYLDRFDGQWRNICESPLFMLDGDYRVKPEVVKPKWPETTMTDCQLDGAYENNYGYYERLSAVANRAIAHALETGLVVLPEATVKPAQIDYKKDLEDWRSIALDAALNEFIEIHRDKEYASCMDAMALRSAILKYLECVERDAI